VALHSPHVSGDLNQRHAGDLFRENARLKERVTPMSEQQNTPNYIELAAEIVSAFVSNNSVPAAELPALIGNVHDALNRITVGSAQKVEETKQPPAVPVKKSVQPDYIVCLDDGKKFKSLKRHLRTVYNMTPDQYRAKWSLPADYPMVAPNYAAARSQLAKQMGLGARRRKTAEAEPVQAAAPARGRRKKVA
jgi:predicted transcriptional regulator